MRKTTILIAEDYVLVRETWSYLLSCQPNLQVVGEVGTAEEAIDASLQLLPDIVIMDINLPGMNGFEATQKLNECCPASKVLIVSMHTQPSFARKIMKKGAMGYVTKSSTSEELIAAIDNITQGKKYICKEIMDLFSDQIINGLDPDLKW